MTAAISSRSPAKLRTMRAKVQRGPHLICYRCDSLDVGPTGACQWCEAGDMVALCHLAACAACRAARSARVREWRRKRRAA